MVPIVTVDELQAFSPDPAFRASCSWARRGSGGGVAVARYSRDLWSMVRMFAEGRWRQKACRVQVGFWFLKCWVFKILEETQASCFKMTFSRDGTALSL